MRLYYLPGSCALAPHIALEHGGVSYEVVRVERGKQSEPEYLSINPLGRVPALVTPHQAVITEVPAVLSFIADSLPNSGFLPPVGEYNRYDVLRWLGYLSSTIHPAFGRLWRSERFTNEANGGAGVETAAMAQLAIDFTHIDYYLDDREFLVGNSFTVADFYLFVFGRWGFRLPEPTQKYPNLCRHTLSIADLPATLVAMKQQGITLEGPKSGPG